MDTNKFRVVDLVTREANIFCESAYQLKLTSKRLKSGKCQVKFFATIREKKDMYGYVLVDGESTLNEVVTGIEMRLDTISQTRDYHNLHLYSIGKMSKSDLNFIIFDH
jgi:hypothetical protein